MGKRKLPKVFSIEELEKKGTKELLGYLKRLRRCEESFQLSDIDINPDLTNAEVIYFKQSERWRAAYKNVKAILEIRKHVN